MSCWIDRIMEESGIRKNGDISIPMVNTVGYGPYGDIYIAYGLFLVLFRLSSGFFLFLVC